MSNRPIYTPELGREVASSAKGIAGRFHVIPYSFDWNVVPDGSGDTLEAFSTMEEAVVYAKRLAVENNSGEVIIHSNQGEVVQRIAI